MRHTLINEFWDMVCRLNEFEVFAALSIFAAGNDEARTRRSGKRQGRCAKLQRTNGITLTMMR